MRKLICFLLCIVATFSLCACRSNLFGYNGPTTTTKPITQTTTELTTNPNVSVLSGKKIVYDGDSVCEGYYGGGGYAAIIGELTGSISINKGKGGGRLRTQVGADDSFHSVVDNVKNLPKDADLYCFQGGVNDWWTYGVLGTYDKNDFTGELDTTTVCGALEAIFRYALENFEGKPICFVITHKVQSIAYKTNANGNTFAEYHDAMIGICEKYSIPYYDAFCDSGLNGWDDDWSSALLTGNAEGEQDGCHPSEEGYRLCYVPQMIELFENMLKNK